MQTIKGLLKYEGKTIVYVRNGTDTGAVPKGIAPVCVMIQIQHSR